MIVSHHPASFSRRWMTACLAASALCVPAILPGAADAQIAPTIKSPVRTGPVVKPLTISPRVDRIAGIATNPCGNRSTLFERGVTPPLLRAPTGGTATIGRTITTPPTVTGPLQPAQASPYAEVLGGVNGALSALQFTGPVMDTISRAELIIGTGAAREVRIIGRFAPSSQCEGRFGQGNGAVSLSLPLPDVSVRTTAKIRLYGFPRAVIQDPARGRLCFLDPSLGVSEPVPCTDTRAPNRPAPLVEEIELVIVPQFQLDRVVSPTNGFSSTAALVGGRVQVAGRNLDAALFPDQIAAGFNPARGISRSRTEWVGELFREFPNGPGSVDALLQPRVSLMRHTEKVEMTIWDTAQDNNGRLLSQLRIRFERRAAAAAPPPPAPPAPPTINNPDVADVLPGFPSIPAPLLRKIGGLGSNIMVSPTFCTGLANNEARTVPVPALVWGASSARAAAPSVRVELRDESTGALLDAFDTGALAANSAAVTRTNYPGRPSTVRVVRVTGAPLMADYGNQTGCFLDNAAPRPRLDPPINQLLLRVDTTNVVAEGADFEANNELRL